MAKTLISIVILTSLATFGGCDSKSTAAKFCLGDDGTVQDCTICCDVDKAKECCEKAEKLTAAQKAK